MIPEPVRSWPRRMQTEWIIDQYAHRRSPPTGDAMPARGRQWDATRAIAKQQARSRNDPCAYCGKPIDWTAAPRTPSSYSADHVTPTSQGGSDRLSNLRTLHYGCNSTRGDGTRGDFPTSRKW